jgi:DNA-binding Lrp family transcriptional regulator
MPAQPQLDNTARKARRVLEREGTVTDGALARRLGRSQRHVRRIVERLEAASVPVEKSYEGRERAYSIPPSHRRKRVPVRLSSPALRRLHELAKEDDHGASAEVAAALRRALRAEP